MKQKLGFYICFIEQEYDEYNISYWLGNSIDISLTLRQLLKMDM